jgi:hypothetical protein
MPINSIKIQAIIESTLKSNPGRLMNNNAPNNRGEQVIAEILKQANQSIQSAAHSEATDVQD